MDKDKLEKDIALMKVFNDMKAMLDPYEVLAKLSEEYRTSSSYEPIKNVVFALKTNETICLRNVINSIVDHLNDIVTGMDMDNNESEKPKMVSLTTKNRDTYIIKVSTRILTEFPIDINTSRVKEMINSIPQYEKFVIKVYNQIIDNKNIFDKALDTALAGALERFDLDGFAVPEVVWDKYNRSCCRYIIKYFSGVADKVGKDISYSLNFAVEDNFKRQLSSIDRKVHRAFEENIMPTVTMVAWGKAK